VSAVQRIHATVVSGSASSAVVTVQGDRIVEVTAASGRGEGLLVPGFIDQHCHGGGGHDVATHAAQVADFHLRHGTTTMVASLVTASAPSLKEQVAALVPLVERGVIGGIHLEGPWLSPQQCGAHDASQLRRPDAAELGSLLASGSVRMVTFAPELPGALAAIRQTVAAGSVAAIGHTDCDYDLAVCAIEAGATVATHLFNRMPHLGKRHPGPVLALLEDPRVFVELIADGLHVDRHLLRYVIATAQGRVSVVTDAMAAAGMGDGDYLLGELPVHVRDGQARLASDHALAGSTLTMDRALRTVVAAGVPLPDAVTTLTRGPARAMGFSDRGVIEAGSRADLVLLDDELQVTRVMRSGNWLV